MIGQEGRPPGSQGSRQHPIDSSVCTEHILRLGGSHPGPWEAALFTLVDSAPGQASRPPLGMWL